MCMATSAFHSYAIAFQSVRLFVVHRMYKYMYSRISASESTCRETVAAVSSTLPRKLPLRPAPRPTCVLTLRCVTAVLARPLARAVPDQEERVEGWLGGGSQV
jgi:hypothetical protein